MNKTFVWFFPCNYDVTALAPFLGSNISRPFRSASGRILPHNIARMERLCLHLQPSDTHPDSFTPHSVNWVLVGRAEYCCKYVFLYATRMPCEEDYIFDPEKIRRIASESCNTQCNDRVAISILGVQCNNKNAPKFCELIVHLLNAHVYGTMLSTQIVFPIIILTHVAVG